MKIKQGFAYPDGRRVAVFDSLGITDEVVRTAYPTLLDLAHENGLECSHFRYTGAVAFSRDTRIVCDVHYRPRDEIIYDSGFFRIANEATKILTGISLLSAIREYGKSKREQTT